MSPIGLVLLLAALAVLVAAEWPRLARRTGLDATTRRARTRKKSHLKVVKDDTDEFAQAVERDLANLPTFDPRAKKND